MPDGLTVPGVPKDVDCSSESGVGVLRPLAPAPSTSFNSAYSFTGSKKFDAMATKSLGMEGRQFLYIRSNLRQPLSVVDEVTCSATPWEPLSLKLLTGLFRIMERCHNIHYHWRKDLIYIKQHPSSLLSVVEIKNYIHDLGHQRFTENEIHTGSGPIRSMNKETETLGFNSQGVHPQPPSTPYIAAKESPEWARTVYSAPDVIHMTLFPITTLLEAAIPGKDHLIRVINLYLESKHFLEFQLPRVWAPIRDEHSRHQRKEPVCPSLQFSLMGKKLYISQEQHLFQRSSSLTDAHITIGAAKWQGPEEQDSRWFEPVKWNSFSHISTVSKRPVHEAFYRGSPVAPPGDRQDHSPSAASNGPTAGPSNNTYLDPGGSGAGSSDAGKFVKIVDRSELCKGPGDMPGHWLVTGWKIGVEKGRIVLRVKYSLLNY
ncbi:hypothetical protein ZWY2020_024679 [Hordeum vulgare]|nr:hypothetical protein ZWY2020_024679 [Hordeum vulgare]